MCGSRQLVVSIDGEKVATLLYGESVTREVPPGQHRLRVHNTLVWKTDRSGSDGRRARLFTAVNVAGFGTVSMLGLLGAGPALCARGARQVVASTRVRNPGERGTAATRGLGCPDRALEALGPVRQRARLGDGARGLQRRGHALGVLPPRSRALARLPLERGRPRRHLRPPSDHLLRHRALERTRSDPEGTRLRAHRPRRQPRRGRQGVLLLSRQHARPTRT